LLPRRKDNTDLDEQARERPFIGATQERSKQFVEQVGFPIFPNAMLSRQRLQLPLPQERKGLRQDEHQVRLREL
jgi:hypothetical protein